MGSRYDESARRLAEQKKQRMRVIKRRKAAQNLTAGVLVIAMSVGMAYMFVKAWDKEAQIYEQQMAEYRAEMHIPQISEEERKEAERAYVEDHYSPETIGDLKISVINEYGILIDIIVENESLKVNSNVEPLDANRLDETIAKYGKFKIECEQDKTDYASVSEEERINKASSLYNKRKSLLEAQLVELSQKGKYLVEGTPEYLSNEEEMEDIKRKINSVNSALHVTMDRGLTIYVEKQREEEGKQR